MCAIFGLIFQNGHKPLNSDKMKTIVKRLFLENMSRGRDASGVAYVTGHSIEVVKTNLPANEFISMKEYAEAENKYMDLVNNKTNNGLISILGHCRWKTKGSEKNNDNNHPIVHGNIVGTHNGVITNDDELFTIFSTKIKRRAEVDSEIIFALIDDFAEVCTPVHDAIIRTGALLSGSYSCSMVHRRHPHLVWLFRNGNPCVVLHYKKAGVVIWSSVDSYITNAVAEALGEETKIPLEPSCGIAIDSYRNRLYRYKMNPEITYISHGG